MAARTANRTSRRAPLNLRTTDELRARLEKAALDAGHNLTQEVERRVEQSFGLPATRVRLPEEVGPAMRVEALPCRGLRRNAAARYVGVSATKLDEMVKDGRMPKPFRIDGCVLWDVRALDLAFDALMDQTDGGSGWGL